MVRITRRTFVAGLAAAAVARPDRALAAWPERNVSLIHGLTAGGGVDVSARVIAEGMSRKLGQQFVVEPTPGAAGTLMSAKLARATPDGYTLGWFPSGFPVSAAMYKSLPYKPLDDFTFIGLALEFPFVLVTYAGSPLRNIRDVVNAAKERKEPVLCGVPGAGTPQHLLIEYFCTLAGIKVQPVTFRGGNQALTELLGKRIDFLIDPPIALIGQIKAGSLQAIAVTGEKPYAPLPDVSTVASSGFPGFNVTSWMGMAGPPKLPQEIASRLNTEINALIKEPDVVERIHKLGSEPKGGTQEEFKQRIATEIARWTKVIADAKIERI